MTESKDIRTAWEKQPDGFPDFLKENPGLIPRIESERKEEKDEQKARKSNITDHISNLRLCNSKHLG